MSAPRKKGIVARGIAKSFRSPDGRVDAVTDVDLSIAPGETVALLGPNGAGKSTTIDMLLGLNHPDRGEVRLFGEDPAEAVADGRIGAMLQTGSLIPDLAVRELVEMIAALYPSPLDVEEVLELTGIGSLAGRRTQKLSGGETQRARFALALVSNPELLVLDEPTVGMDVEGRRAFWETMREMARRGKTILFATHYLEEANTNADRAILMARGRIIADGPPTEIRGRVGTRTITATIPDADLSALSALPGVARAELHGQVAILSWRRDSDRDHAGNLLATCRQASDLAISGAGLADPNFRRAVSGARMTNLPGNADTPPRRQCAEPGLYFGSRPRMLCNRASHLFMLSWTIPAALYFLIVGLEPARADLLSAGISAPLCFM